MHSNKKKPSQPEMDSWNILILSTSKKLTVEQKAKKIEQVLKNYYRRGRLDG